MENNMSIKSMNLSWIVVNDIKKAITFYTDVVGLKLEEYHEQFGWAELTGLEGGCKLGIAQKNDADPILPGQNAVITMSVDNLDVSIASMKEKGANCVGDVVEIPGMIKMQLVTDIDGNYFQLVQSI